MSSKSGLTIIDLMAVVSGHLVEMEMPEVEMGDNTGGAEES